MARMYASGYTGPTVYLVEEQANPSTDYFVFPAVSGTGARVVACTGNDIPALEDLAGATVVFVRYIPTRWLRVIETVRPVLSALVFFMDDDVLDIGASAGMPLRYRYKLARLAAFRKGWLRRQNAELWVSTPYLRDKYARWNPKLVLPLPLPGLAHARHVFYHGTASHMAEIRWLRPVVEEALRQDENLWFEITGGDAVYRLYRGLPRVTVVHPMKWPSYQRFLLASERHVGLAPLLESRFNKARSYTKVFDFTRCGAVGIYAAASAYEDVVTDGVEGRLLPMQPEHWVRAIGELARNDESRMAMLHRAHARIRELATAAATAHSITPCRPQALQAEGQATSLH